MVNYQAFLLTASTSIRIKEHHASGPFLHLDLNAGEAEIKALDTLFDRVNEGGIILLDDYGRLEHNQLFSNHNDWFANKGYRILELPTGQGMVIKRKIKNLDKKIKCADLKSAH